MGREREEEGEVGGKAEQKVSLCGSDEGRPEELERLARSLAEQSRLPNQVVVVDASAEPVAPVVEPFLSLNVKYIRAARPSGSQQRNVGIRAVDEGIDLIGFVDDDAVLASGAMGAMSAFWAQATTEVGGPACWA